MARNMDDLLLLDSVLRDSNATTRAFGGLPAPGVPCAAPVDRNLSLEGVVMGLPLSFWPLIDPAVGPPALGMLRPWTGARPLRAS